MSTHFAENWKVEKRETKQKKRKKKGISIIAENENKIKEKYKKKKIWKRKIVYVEYFLN